MPGQPILREMRRRIEAAGGVEAMFRRVADGETIKAIAESLGVTRANLSDHLNKPKHIARLREAKRLGASALVEEARDIADGAEPAEAQAAKLRIDIRTWTAARWDREQYGDKAAPQVVVDLRELHAQTVRERQRRDEAAERTLPAPAAAIEAPPEDQA